MKANSTDKVIVGLTIIILAIAAILYSVMPRSAAQAVEFTAGTPSETVHFFPNSERESRYAMQNDVTASLIGDCLADRVTGDLYPQPDPYCLPVPSVTVAETIKRDTDDTQTPIIVDVPVTPEQPVIIDNGGEEIPTEEPETPETPSEPEQPEKKNKCNKGSGNGSEGCDPGNHPENGNNDEGGNRRPENSNGGGHNN